MELTKLLALIFAKQQEMLRKLLYMSGRYADESSYYQIETELRELDKVIEQLRKGEFTIE